MDPPLIHEQMKGYHQAQGRAYTCPGARSIHGLLLMIGAEGDSLGPSQKGITSRAESEGALRLDRLYMALELLPRNKG
jgi:hypothetical protein